jgi:hypothetical protein
MWLQYETRTDDITIIVLKLKGLGKHMRGASRRNLEARPAYANPVPPPVVWHERSQEMSTFSGVPDGPVTSDSLRVVC